MAAGISFQDLAQEATCPICLEYFKDPVTIAECGHNYCRACLAKFWGESAEAGLCPECRETGRRKNLIPNRPLSNIVKILPTEEYHLQEENVAEGPRTVCEKHQQPLKLFCRDDVTPVCEQCKLTEEHKDHEVISGEEAAQEYKNQICCCIPNLRKVEEKLLSSQEDTVQETQRLLEKAEGDRQKMVDTFKELHQLLEISEKTFLGQLNNTKKEIEEEKVEHLARISRELSSLTILIQEMEEKCQQPASELLEDVRSILQRSEMKEKSEMPLPFPSILKWLVWASWTDNVYLESITKQLKDSLRDGVELHKEFLTFDPVTAHPCLILSKDEKKLKMEEEYRDLPSHPERFNQVPAVLAKEGFSSGRHFWDVEVGLEKEWAVGVARKSVRRKGALGFGAKEGIWVLGTWGFHYLALNHPGFNIVRPSEPLKKIRVFLNYLGGTIAFFDLKTTRLLFTFLGAQFFGEPVYPFFFLNGKSQFRLASSYLLT
uniref:Tripartite motif containing 39 n=1 Tax=Anolis carolinensis TaxID=28377 RepID=A0A803TLI2_ANOCA|nr:PREDICTED: zinc finger protein RFP [Anolis carolinensis]|eukprot:XP_008103932.1 PREDICTED: zinc finger protein RFP [Anolis carolinensis]